MGHDKSFISLGPVSQLLLKEYANGNNMQQLALAANTIAEECTLMQIVDRRMEGQKFELLCHTLLQAGLTKFSR